MTKTEEGEKFKLSEDNMGALLLIFLEKLISNQMVSDHKLASSFCYVNGKSIEQFIYFGTVLKEINQARHFILLTSYIDIYRTCISCSKA